MIRKALPLLLLVLVMLALADAALACAVCNGGEDLRTRDSYLNATIFMSVMPLGVIGGGLWYLRRRARALASAGDPVLADPVLADSILADSDLGEA